ncbi:MAG: hypothetical protein FWH03_02455 [Firmicutes bacterium]|nr:hypothetical protein [Bacillota bacterium]
MYSKSRQIAVSAVGVALAAPCIVLTNYLPLSVSLLIIAAAAYFIVFEKAGIGFGILCMCAATALSFIGGVGTGQILNLILFVPYTGLAYGMRKLTFGNVKHMALRAGIVLVFANVVFLGVFYLIRAAFLSEFISPDFVGSAGYFAVAALFSAVTVLTDILFERLCSQLCRRIKIRGLKNSVDKKPDTEDAEEAEDTEDIFKDPPEEGDNTDD